MYTFINKLKEKKITLINWIFRFYILIDRIVVIVLWNGLIIGHNI